MALGPELLPGEGLLIQGENLEVMKRLHSAWGSCLDFIYADPPFFSGRTFRSPSGRPRSGFQDRWPEGLDSYLAWLGERFQLMRELLADTGTMMVHLDAHAVHYVKVECDRIFGRDHFLNEIIWHYTGGGRSKRYFSRKHDNLLWYRKGKEWTFQIDAVRVPYRKSSGYARSGIVSARGKRYLPNRLGTPIDDVWDLPMVNPLSRERTGYPTQKPESLLNRILQGCTRPGDLVADFFCGSGTTGVAAQRLARRWILCDDSPGAISICRDRIGKSAGVRLRRAASPKVGKMAYRFTAAAAGAAR